MIKTADLTPRQKKIAITLCAILLIYILFGFIGAPFIVRSLLEKQVAEAINRQVTVGPVRINPITLSATLRDLNIRESGGAPFLKLDEAYAQPADVVPVQVGPGAQIRAGGQSGHRPGAHRLRPHSIFQISAGTKRRRHRRWKNRPTPAADSPWRYTTRTSPAAGSQWTTVWFPSPITSMI